LRKEKQKLTKKTQAKSIAHTAGQVPLGGFRGFYYAGSYVYEDNFLAYRLFSEGRRIFYKNTWQYEYHLSDHLGNVRAAFDQTGTVKQENHYYPFGLRISDLGLQNSENKYLYNGKEMQDEFGLDWHDYGARFYDAQIGRWHVADPMAEMYYHLTPYNYVGNSPIEYFDPNGMFRTKFGAWWYKVWNGGDAIGQHKGGEYFVTTTNASESEKGGVTVTASRVFDRKGRNFGRNLAFQRAAEDYVSQMRFEEDLKQMGAEIRYTDSRIEAFSSWYSFRTS